MVLFVGVAKATPLFYSTYPNIFKEILDSLNLDSPLDDKIPVQATITHWSKLMENILDIGLICIVVVILFGMHHIARSLDSRGK